jgi:oligoribonuclease NrnB/cAMP/cGMP phosphodiesterase (DHH superfamily)
MIKIFYHQVKPGVDCPDGEASAWAIQKAARRWHLRDEIQIVGCCYQSDLPEVNEGDRVYIVDFSFPRAVLEEWKLICLELTVIDHHKTALQDLEGFSDAIFDMTECGATLTWKTVHRHLPVPAFLEYVRDRDLWKHELPATQEIHEAVSSVKYKINAAVNDETIARSLVFAFFDQLAEMSQDELIAYLKPIGEGLLEEKRKKVEAIADRWQLEDIAGEQVPVVILANDGSEDRFVSDVCHRLYKDKGWAHSPFVACKTSDGSWSLRSDQDNPNAADVSEIAKQFGGEGHKNSAGYRPMAGGLDD